MQKIYVDYAGGQMIVIITHTQTKEITTMKSTVNEAIAILETGNEDKAWEIAQQDEGLNEGVTKEQWVTFAHKAIENRKAQELANRNFFWD